MPCSETEIYVTGTNSPGFLPDTEVCQHESYTEAKTRVIQLIDEDMEFYGDSVHLIENRAERDDLESMLLAMQRAKDLIATFTEGQFSITAGGREYWVALDPQV